MNPPVIALGCSSRVGKDTCVDFMVQGVKKQLYAAITCHYDLPFRSVKKCSFSSHLKDAAQMLFGVYGLQPWAFYDREENQHLRDVKLPTCNLSPVEIWIGFGDKIREIYANVFADNGVLRLPRDQFSIFTSLRFMSEVEAVRSLGGWCVKVERVPSPPPRALDRKIPPDFEWDAVIVNDGDLETLKERAVQVLHDYMIAKNLA